MDLQPVEIFAHFPFDHIRPNAFKQAVDALEDGGDDTLGLDQPLQLIPALED